jgi:hypothetical protein
MPEDALHPTKHNASPCEHALPIHPQTHVLDVVSIVFLLYAGALPGTIPPQQHICAEPPAPPHTSIVAVPFPGACQNVPYWKQLQ